MLQDRRRLTRSAAFPLVAGAFGVTMLGTTLPTPLYPLYRQQLGFSELMVTVVFAVYAAGVIVALLLLGGMSDLVGRRRMLLAGIALSAASAVAFLAEGGLSVLLLGRVLSGLSAGIFTGTATIAVVELAPPEHHHERAALVATAANMGGLGFGPLLAGVLAQYAALPLSLCFLVDLALLAVAAGAVLAAPETVASRRPAHLKLQRLTVPAGVRSVFLPAALAGFAGFAVLGLFTAVAPALLGTVLHHPNHALTGGVVFLLFTSSTVGQLVLGRVSERSALPIGCVALVLGVALVALGIALPSLPLLITGAVVAGLGQGLGFRAGMTAVTAASPDDRRAEVASTFFVVLYVAISIPVIGVGVAGQAYGLQGAGVGFAVVVAILALLALVGVLRHQRRQASSPKLEGSVRVGESPSSSRSPAGDEPPSGTYS